MRAEPAVLSHIQVALTVHSTDLKSAGNSTEPLVVSVLRGVVTWPLLPAVKHVNISVHTDRSSELAGQAMRRVDLPRAISLHILVSRVAGYGLAHQHRKEWKALLREPTCRATLFVYLEHDLFVPAASLIAWAADQALLKRAGALAFGFRRSFYRFELSQPVSAASPVPTRLLVDEREPRRWIPGRTRWALPDRKDKFFPGYIPPFPGHPRLWADPATMRCSTVPDAACEVNQSLCVHYPFVRARDPQGGASRLFLALLNPYSGMTVARRADVALFAKHPMWTRFRWREYGTR